MKISLGKPYQLPSGRWVVYAECPDGKMRRFTCKQASPVYEVYQNPHVRRLPRKPVRIRYDILARDNYTCQYCGRKAPDVVLHIDHMVPVSKGGTDEPTNLITACADCNEGKGPRHSGGVVDPRPDLYETTMERMRAAMDKLHNVLGPEG